MSQARDTSLQHGSQHPGADVATRTAVAPGKSSPVQKRYAGTGAVVQRKAAGPQAAAIPVIITASRLRVRSEPSTKSNDTILGSLPRGARVDALGKQGNWLRIDFEGTAAYIHGGYTKPAETQPSTDTQGTQGGQGGQGGGQTPTSSDTSSDDKGTTADQGQSNADSDPFGFAALFTWLSDVAGALQGEDAVEDNQKPTSDKGGGTTPENGPTTPENNGKDPDEPEHDNDIPLDRPAEVRDADLASYMASLKNPYVDDMARDLAALQAKSTELWDGRSAGEERGKGRDELVADIGALRAKIAGLDSAGLSPDDTAKLKTLMYRAVHDVAPYYAQSTNIDLLEGKEQAKELGTETSVTTRTCNITSLAMALESLGKSPADYSGSKAKIDAIAKVFSSEAGTAKMTVGKGVSGMRMSDFLQFAAIAERLSSGTSAQAVKAAAVSAWDKILSIGFLKTLASRFGVGGSVKLFSVDAGASDKEKESETYKLRQYGKKHRKGVEKLVDARNKWEASGSDKDKAAYEKLKKEQEGALGGKGIEDDIGIEAYKNSVISQIGAELDGGSAVVVLLSGHYVRLQAIHDDHCVVDDPGRQSRSNRKVLWPEARAMGYFSYRLVLG